MADGLDDLDMLLNFGGGGGASGASGAAPVLATKTEGDNTGVASASGAASSGLHRRRASPPPDRRAAGRDGGRRGDHDDDPDADDSEAFDDDELLASLFSASDGEAEPQARDTPVASSRASPPPPRAQHRSSRLVCFLCRCTPTDEDLSDATGDRRVPFANPIVSAGVVACDHCEGFMRYVMMNRSRADIQQRLQVIDDTFPVARKWAWYMALKRHGTTRVSSARVEEVILMNETHLDILNKFMRKLGYPSGHTPPGPPPPSPASSHLVALQEYVRNMGNPFVNGHTLLPSAADGVVTIFVQVPGPLGDVGRFSLATAVANGLGNHVPRDGGFQQVRDMNVDDMGIVRLVQELVAEYRSRAMVLQTVGSAAPRHSAPSRAPTSSFDGDASPAGRRRVASAPSRCRASASPTLDARGKARAAGGSATARARSRSRRRRSPSSGGGLARAASRATRSTPRKTQDDGAPRVPMSSGPIVKAFAKIQKNVQQLGDHFTSPGWQRSVRGKDGKGKTAMTQLDTLEHRCRRAHKEDIVEDIIELRSIVESLRLMFQEGRWTAAEEWDTRYMSPHIERVENFMIMMSGGSKPCLAANLLKLKARGER